MPLTTRQSVLRIWTVTLFCVLLFAWGAQRIHAENERLRSAIREIARMQPPTASRESALETPYAEENPVQRKELERLEEEIRVENASRQSIEEQIAAFKPPAAAPEEEAELTQNMKLRQSAADLAELFDALSRNPAAMNPGRAVNFMSQIELLKTLENSPTEIADYYATLLQRTFGLNNLSREKVAANLEAGFTGLAALQLTNNFQPKKEPQEWFKKRDAKVVEIARSLHPLLPANHPKLKYIPMILSMGGGLRTEIQIDEKGKGSVNLRLPLTEGL